MNNLVPGYGDHFRDQFINGLKMVITNSARATLASVNGYMAGQILLNDFGDWYLANRDAIIRRRTVSR